MAKPTCFLVRPIFSRTLLKFFRLILHNFIDGLRNSISTVLAPVAIRRVDETKQETL